MHLWNRSAETAGDVAEAEDDDGDPPDCVKANQSWPVWCEKKLNGWIISHLSPSRGNSEREKHRNRQPRVHGRSVQATNREV